MNFKKNKNGKYKFEDICNLDSEKELKEKTDHELKKNCDKMKLSGKLSGKDGIKWPCKDDNDVCYQIPKDRPACGFKGDHPDCKLFLRRYFFNYTLSVKK